MKHVSTIGLDLAKQVFQVHGADAEGSPVFNRQLRRSEVLRFFAKLPPCLARRPFKVAAVALANKMARIVWALLNKGGNYRPSEPAAMAAITVQ